VFNDGDATSSQSTGAIDISGDNISVTSGKTGMAVLSSSEENESTCGRGSIVMSESFRSALPMDDSRLEATCSATESQTDNMIALISVFRVIAGTKVRFSPGDSLSTVSGVGETSIAVSSGSRGVTASRVASSTCRNPGTASISLTSNMIPNRSSSRKTSDGFTIGLAINVEFSTRG